jgi:hypothetical protein
MYDADQAGHGEVFICPATLTRFVESRIHHPPATWTRLTTVNLFVCDREQNTAYATFNAVREALAPFESEGLLLTIKCGTYPSPNWIQFDPELKGRPELLEIF